MISNQQTARSVSDLMLEIGSKLNDSVAQVQATCTEAEFNQYRGAVGTIMGGLLFEVMNPLYAAHPELKPSQLK